MKRFLREFLPEIIFIAVFVTIWFSAIETCEIFQTSMEPNFHEGQRVVVNKAAYWSWTGDPKRGDVIILNGPDGASGDFIKRVIGIPGDTLEIIHGVTYINGIAIDEPYVVRSFSYSYEKITIPENEYFVLGDNRDVSNDSHRWGLLPRQDIVGKVLVIYWPPQSWGWVPKYDLSKQLSSGG